MRTMRSCAPALFTILALASAPGCISRAAWTPQQTPERFEGWFEERRSYSKAELDHMPRPRSFIKTHMHLEARTECTGLVTRKQRTEAKAWVTEPGWDGPEKQVSVLALGFRYQGGFFEGVKTHFPRRNSSSAYGAEVISGVESYDICTCVLVNAIAKVRGGTVRATEMVCPDADGSDDLADAFDDD